MTDRSSLFIFKEAKPNLPEIDEWLHGEPAELFSIARYWFEEFRRCGNDVNELLHDGCPTACVEHAAFGYINVFTAHVNVGFFPGAYLDDPELLLQGTGKRMRHVKLRPGDTIDALALTKLIQLAYLDVKTRLQS